MTTEGAPPLSGEPLAELVASYQGVQADVERLARVYPRDVMWPMMIVPALSVEDLQEEAKVQVFVRP